MRELNTLLLLASANAIANSVHAPPAPRLPMQHCEPAGPTDFDRQRIDTARQKRERKAAARAARMARATDHRDAM